MVLTDSRHPNKIDALFPEKLTEICVIMFKGGSVQKTLYVVSSGAGLILHPCFTETHSVVFI